MRKSQMELEAKLNKLGASLDASMTAWSNSEEAKTLQANGARFFKTKLDTPQMRRVDQRNEKNFNRLVGSVTHSDYDLEARGQPSNIHIGNAEIIANAENDIKNKRIAEQLVNSPQGQELIRNAAAAAQNQEAQAVGANIETGVATIVDHPDPKGMRAFERDM